MFFDFFTVELDESCSVKKLLLRFQFSGIAKPMIHGYINGVFVGTSEKVKQGAIVVSEAEHPEFLLQGAYLQASLQNTQTDQELWSETKTFFVFHKADSRNGWNPQPITYISDSEFSKSMILPPVATAKGKLYHFKYLGTRRPFILMSSLTNREYPLRNSEIYYHPSETLEDIFESTIEGTWKFQLSHTNQCVSVVSDGLSWLVVNNYEGTFTSIGKGVLPQNTVVEQTKSHFLNYYWNNDASNNILLSDLRQNSLKFLHVHRFLPDTGILNIYAPQDVRIEGKDISGNEHTYLSICLSNKALLSSTCSFILSSFNKKLYILSQYDGQGFHIADYPESARSLETSLTISHAETVFKIPSLPPNKQETKFFLIKHTSEGTFTLAAANPSETSLYTPKNGLRDCITYTKSLHRYCFWILVYVDNQLGGQTTAVIMNKYTGE
jgi:hypothetical protein